MLSKAPLLACRVAIVATLYLLQGLVQGFSKSMSLYLASHKASWKEQATFSWTVYPYSFKILWAPVLDSVYSHRFGRHQTWLVPIQLLAGIVLLVLAFYLEFLLINLRVALLTAVFFFLYFLISSQDIVVDGWAVSSFNRINPQWASTCQYTGQTLGSFIGSTVLLTFESPHFMNKFIRPFLSLPQQPHGLFSLRQFTIFWAVAFLVVTVVLLLMSLCTRLSHGKDDGGARDDRLRLLDTYLDIWRLLKKRCMQKFIFMIVTYGVGFAATSFMTDLVLVDYGVTRDTIGLLNIPLLLVRIITTACLSSTRQPLVWFIRAYIPRLVISLLLAIYIFFTPQLLHTPCFYPVLIVLFCLNEIVVCAMTVASLGFFARISEPRIGGTYMTLLATLYNLGHTLSSTVVRYVADWLPKPYAYSIEVGMCLLLGLLWIALMWRFTIHIGELPIEEWYVKPSTAAPELTATSAPQINRIDNTVHVGTFDV